MKSVGRECTLMYKKCLCAVFVRTLFQNFPSDLKPFGYFKSSILNEFSVSVLPAFVRTINTVNFKNTVLSDVMPCRLVDVF